MEPSAFPAISAPIGVNSDPSLLASCCETAALTDGTANRKLMSPHVKTVFIFILEIYPVYIFITYVAGILASTKNYALMRIAI